MQSKTININKPEQTVFFDKSLENDKSNADVEVKSAETNLANKESYKSQVCNET